jgi:hypothetical protein
MPMDHDPSPDEAQAYVSLSESEAVESATAAGIKDIRIVEVGGALSTDYRPHRLTLVIENEQIVRARFG